MARMSGSCRRGSLAAARTNGSPRSRSSPSFDDGRRPARDPAHDPPRERMRASASRPRPAPRAPGPSRQAARRPQRFAGSPRRPGRPPRSLRRAPKLGEPLAAKTSCTAVAVLRMALTRSRKRDDAPSAWPSVRAARSLICRDASRLRSASRRTSFATTLKPAPWSPARAASIPDAHESERRAARATRTRRRRVGVSAFGAGGENCGPSGTRTRDLRIKSPRARWDFPRLFGPEPGAVCEGCACPCGRARSASMRRPSDFEVCFP
jgi:hypothetical protein